jgi:hypothetical protein
MVMAAAPIIMETHVSKFQSFKVSKLTPEKFGLTLKP